MSSLPDSDSVTLNESAAGTTAYATLRGGLAAADDARDRGDSLAAMRVLGDLRQRFPEQPAPYLRAAALLSQSRRFDEAETLLAAGAQRFPNDPGFAIERAWLAYRRGDFVDAIARWHEIRQSLPEHHVGYTGGAASLRGAGRFAEADAVLLEAMQRFPNDPGPHTEYAWVAQIARDWPEAIRRWEEVRQRHPEQIVGFTVGAIALREARRFDDAEALLRGALDRFPGDRAPLVEHAWLAAARRDWSEAARRWALVREHFPDLVEAHLRGAQALLALWQHDEAEALLSEAMDRFPQDSAVACEHAWIAYHRHQLDEAARRFEAVRRRFPDLVAGYTAGATVLRDQFRLAEAEAMLETAQGRFPDEPRLPYEHARIPLFHPLRRERDPEEALRRAERLLARFPLFEDGHLLAVRTLRELGRSAEADELAQIGIGLLPNSAAIAIEHAQNSRERGDWPEAIWRYGAARQRFPNHAGGSIGLAAALSQSGRDTEAEQVLRDAMQRFPADPAVFAEFARIAVRREDWAEALARWSEAQQRFPDEQEFAHRIFDARLHLTESQPGPHAADAAVETGAEPGAETGAATDPREATRELVMQFESLGGRGLGCEFGMFQREFGAEPLGLLRWADMPYDGAIFALENRFDGVGTPEHTHLFVNRENSRPEYCTEDRRGFMFMRAFVYEDEMPYERMWKQALRRLGFLKDKLIADLEAGGKIFVYRLTDRNLDPAELERLRAAVRGYGDNMLLYVRYADPAHPNGTVELAAPGLMIGYIDRFKMAPDGQLSASPPSASWLAICKNAHALLKTGARVAEPAPRPPVAAAERQAPADDDRTRAETRSAPRWESLSSEESRQFFADYGGKVRSGELRFGRHHYALGMAHAVRTALHCGIGHISAVEIGVATGAGLLELCRSAEFLMSGLGIEISVFGFDRAEGLPYVNGYMDHPELWHTGAFKMPDPAELAAKLPKFARLIIGDIAETLPRFEAELKKAPLGFAAFDVDLYTSTKQALEILKFPPECYLPMVPSIFDDTDTVLTHSRWCGEAAAVREFNEVNSLRKIDPKPDFGIEKFHCCQIFDHPIRQGLAKSRLPLNLGKF